MKILQINSVYNYGSTGRIVKNLHEEIQKSSNTSYVIYGRGEISDEEGIFKIGNHISSFVDGILTRLFNRHGEGNRYNTRRIIKKINDFKPDIIHLHNIHGYYINYEMLFKYLQSTDIPIVWLLHDRWPISGSSAFYNPDKLDWNKPDKKELKKISKNYPKYIYLTSHSAKRNYTKKKLLFNIDNMKVVTPSIWLKKVCQESFFNKQDIAVINNGINLNTFKPYNRTYNKKKILLGVANYWDDNKGLSYFNRLADDLDDGYEIILVGVDNYVMKSINKKIKCIHRTNSSEELALIYSKADIFINPTLDDNFPTVNLEAQACGTPVITFNTGGSGESIVNGTGLVIEKGNYNELKSSIMKWPKKNETIINYCQMNAKKYSDSLMIEKYLDVYKNLVTSLLN